MSARGLTKAAVAGGHDLLHQLHTIIEFIALLANETIFVIAGLVSWRYLMADFLTFRDWAQLFMLYLLVHLFRFSLLVLVAPYLNAHGYGIQRKELLIMSISGLRGAVGLSMVLMVELDGNRLAHPHRTGFRPVPCRVHSPCHSPSPPPYTVHVTVSPPPCPVMSDAQCPVGCTVSFHGCTSLDRIIHENKSESLVRSCW